MRTTWLRRAGASQTTAKGPRPARYERSLVWWAEIFQVPCVAFDVETAEEAARLARAGADFVAVRLGSEAPAAVGERLAAIAEALRMPEAA